MKTAGTTDVFLSAYPRNKMRGELWPYLVLQEAAEVATECKVNTGSPSGIIDQPEQVAECFLYMWDLCCSGGQLIDYDLVTHGANYWVCDDIIRHRQQGDGDGLWRAAEALHHEIRLDIESHQYVPSSELLGPWQIRSKPYWISPTYGLILIPARAMTNGDMFQFQHCADKLNVLKLSRCTFDFRAPPFLCYHSLRFLWLDHCQGSRTSTDGAGKEEDIRRCFQRLWVLDLRYTDCDQIFSAQMLALMTQLRELNVVGAKEWEMGQLQGQLLNIRKLRVKKSGVRCSCSENDLFSEMNKMVHLDFLGNYTAGACSAMMSLFGPEVSSNVSSLETVFIVDGYDGFQQISFSGCTGLKNLDLGGQMWDLHTLDILGTAVKTLDLSTTMFPYLDELYLLDCEKLCAILWPPNDKVKDKLGKLCIDTTQSAPTTQSREEKAKQGNSTAIVGTSVAPAAAPRGSQPSNEFEWLISVRDARLLGSLEPVYSDSCKAYVEISSPHPTVVVGGRKNEGIFKSTSSGEQQLPVNLQRQPMPAVYTDISMDYLQQASAGGANTLGIMWMCPCPDAPDLSEKRCYIHIQDHIKTNLPRGGEETSSINVPRFLIYDAKILHVHDSLSITSITSDEYDSEWPNLEWCRIERCPKLDFVFNTNIGNLWTYQLRIFWASQLLKSRYIWTSYGHRAFPHLTLLHLDFCPRLIHTLPWTLSWNVNDEDNFPLLETLEIAWCGDLQQIFPFTFGSEPNSKDFPKLKRIHLHELPSLQNICGIRMSAPNLETVKIRGCWSLRHLPDIGSNNKVVECDCEKEWWERLEWDDRSQADNYRPIHPRYYKKIMLRGSVLR